MSLYLSASTAATSQVVAQSNDFTVHALRRDKDGMLYYTVARSTEVIIAQITLVDAAGSRPAQRASP